jgi:hypothetical protein
LDWIQVPSEDSTPVKDQNLLKPDYSNLLDVKAMIRDADISLVIVQLNCK